MKGARVHTGQVRDLFRRLRHDVRKAVAVGVEASTHELVGAVKETLNQPGSGRVYVKPGGRTHQASAPGEPPAPDTTTYQGSWQPAGPDKSPRHVRGYAYTDDKRGPWLEYGTERVEARPHAVPTAAGYKDKAATNVRHAVREAVQTIRRPASPATGKKGGK